MNTNRNYILIIVLRIILFLLLTSSVIAKIAIGMYPIESAMMESGIMPSWVATMFVSNGITAIEILAAVFALFGNFKKPHTAIYWFLGLIYLISLLFTLQNQLFWNYPIYYLGYPIFIVLGIVLIFIIATYIHAKVKDKETFINQLIPSILSITAIVSFLIFGPLNMAHLETKTEPYAIDELSNWQPYDTNLASHFPTLIDGDYLACFASVGCSHCNALAQKVGISKRSFGNEIDVLFIFWADSSEIDAFFKRNKLEKKYIQLERNQIINLSGQELPTCYQFVHGKPTQQYVGSEMNYATFDHIFKP